MSNAAGGTLVLGLGNPLAGDDGFGLAVLRLLVAEWSLPPEVMPVDGGTWGMRLLPLIDDAERLLVLDAIDLGKAPGTLIILERTELPRGFAHKLSPHQVDLREVLALADLRGTLPLEAVAIGAQPEQTVFGAELSASLAARVDDVARLALARLAAWGHHCPRTAPCMS